MSSQGVANSLEADVDMIIHCNFRDPDGSHHFREDIADRIAEQGAYVNPTLQVGRTAAWSLAHKRDAEGLIPSERELLDQALIKLELHLDDTRRMIEMGLKVITGSDSSWSNYRLGNTVYEAELLVHAGYTPMQGVMSVTSWAAAALGMDDKVGALDPGKEADILVVEGDPSIDINDLWNVSDVFFAGRKVARGSGDSLAAIRQQPARI